eukprot:1182046-Prorocentrum_minimum.AAC.3
MGKGGAGRGWRRMGTHPAVGNLVVAEVQMCHRQVVNQPRRNHPHLRRKRLLLRFAGPPVPITARVHSTPHTNTRKRLCVTPWNIRRLATP